MGDDFQQPGNFRLKFPFLASHDPDPTLPR
jgi:hypothetical protein